MSQDPAKEDPGGYIYADSNPVSLTDPDGLAARGGKPCPTPKPKPKPKPTAKDHAQKCKRDLQRRLDDCMSKYDPSAVGRKVRKGAVVGTVTGAVGAGAAAACVSGGAAALPAAGVGAVVGLPVGMISGLTDAAVDAWDYRECVSDANKAYDDCMSKWRRPRR